MLIVIKKGTPPAEIKKRIEKVVSKKRKNRIIKYAGKLNIKIDPLRYQIGLRNEWK